VQRFQRDFDFHKCGVFFCVYRFCSSNRASSAMGFVWNAITSPWPFKMVPLEWMRHEFRCGGFLVWVLFLQVLFFEQVRTAMRGGLLQDNLPSNIRALLPPDSSGEISLPELMKGTMVTSSMAVPEEGWDAVHQDYASLKGDLATMRSHIAEAENERNMMQHELAKQQQQKAKSSFLTSFKPRKIFNKIFSSKGFSSSQSSNHSESPVQTSGKELTRQHRNSVG
jgi:hypothetical protein